MPRIVGQLLALDGATPDLGGIAFERRGAVRRGRRLRRFSPSLREKHRHLAQRTGNGVLVEHCPTILASVRSGAALGDWPGRRYNETAR